MRVLYLIDSLVAGGAERSLASLAPGYRRNGVVLDVGYLRERAGVGPALEAAGATLHSLAGNGGMPRAVPRAVKLIRACRPDLVHTTLFEADVVGRIAATLTRVPCVSSLVNAAYGPEQLGNPNLVPWKVRATQGLDAVTARRITRFHAVSQSVADVMSARLHIAPARIDVIPRGRDAEMLGRRTAGRRAAARRAVGAGAESIVLGVGRQEFQKGFDVLLRAFAEVHAGQPTARLLIAGRDGGATADLLALADSLGIAAAVEFLGDRSDVAELLCAADVFAFPSRWEGMPGTVIEAMALEAPIVAAAIDPVREVIGDSGGARLVAVEDAAALAGAITAALWDPSPNVQTAAARDRFVAHFTIDRVADAMVEFYGRAIAEARS